MANILVKIGRIWNSQCKCNYLKNGKPFLNFLFHFWNLHQFLNILRKNMMVIADIFPKLQTVENFVSPFCNKRRNMLLQSTCESVLSSCEITMRMLLSCVFIILRDVDLENVSLSVRSNLGDLCYYIDCRWQVYRWTLREFETPNSNAIIWKTKNSISIFYSISEIYIKF